MIAHSELLVGQALAAKWQALTPALPGAMIEAALGPVPAALERADRAYQERIAAALPHGDATAVQGAMAEFRQRVRTVREAARAELDAMYRRSHGDYGRFDPLDTYVPPATGLSHGESVRAADVADRAKAQVAALRRTANERIVAHVGGQTAALIAAKRDRNVALRVAIDAAVSGLVDPAHEREGLVDALASLVDNWY